MGNKRLSWVRWEWADPYSKDRWSACTVSIYSPTYDRPYVSVLISMANGGGRFLMRTKSLKDAMERVVIPDWGIERLQLAETQAINELEGINRDLRLLYDAKQPGAKIINTETGEVLAEAEKILHKEE